MIAENIGEKKLVEERVGKKRLIGINALETRVIKEQIKEGETKVICEKEIGRCR